MTSPSPRAKQEFTGSSITRPSSAGVQMVGRRYRYHTCRQTNRERLSVCVCVWTGCPDHSQQPESQSLGCAMKVPLTSVRATNDQSHFPIKEIRSLESFISVYITVRHRHERATRQRRGGTAATQRHVTQRSRDARATQTTSSSSKR